MILEKLQLLWITLYEFFWYCGRVHGVGKVSSSKIWSCNKSLEMVTLWLVFTRAMREFWETSWFCWKGNFVFHFRTLQRVCVFLLSVFCVCTYVCGYAGLCGAILYHCVSFYFGCFLCLRLQRPLQGKYALVKDGYSLCRSFCTYVTKMTFFFQIPTYFVVKMEDVLSSAFQKDDLFRCIQQFSFFFHSSFFFFRVWCFSVAFVCVFVCLFVCFCSWYGASVGAHRRVGLCAGYGGYSFSTLWPIWPCS